MPAGAWDRKETESHRHIPPNCLHTCLPLAMPLKTFFPLTFLNMHTRTHDIAHLRWEEKGLDWLEGHLPGRQLKARVPALATKADLSVMNPPPASCQEDHSLQKATGWP